MLRVDKGGKQQDLREDEMERHQIDDKKGNLKEINEEKCKKLKRGEEKWGEMTQEGGKNGLIRVE